MYVEIYYQNADSTISNGSYIIWIKEKWAYIVVNSIKIELVFWWSDLVWHKFLGK